MDDDWDLHAVVRGCAALSTTASASASTASSSHLSTVSFQSFPPAAASGFRDLFEPPPPPSADEELHELYKPFIFGSSKIAVPPQSLPIHSPLSVLGGLQDLAPEQQIGKQIVSQKQQPFCFGNSGSKNVVPHNPTPRAKKRKTHMKRVCHVAAENLSSDVWSWRKYGQKPIKGSPYPRGYYRCSTSKGCLARKQVERNRSDPGMFIVTYTAEHNHPMPTHRNSLAGSTRQKQASSDEKAATCSPVMSPPAAPEKMESSREGEEGEEEEEDGFSASKMDLEDDFFAGLEDFTAMDSGDCAAGVELPWLSTTIAGGG